MGTRFNAMVAGVLLAISTGVLGAGDSVGYVFQPDTAIRANEINANFQELADRIAASGSVSDPSGKLYVFHTGDVTVPTDGRKAYTEQCAAVDPESALCSVERIQTAIAGKGIVYAADFAGGWLDGANHASCRGLTTTGGTGSYMSSLGELVTGVDSDDTAGWECSNWESIVCCK